MCRISKETALRASMELRAQSRAGALNTAEVPAGGVINVSTRICGRYYSRELTFHDIRTAYGASLQTVKGAIAQNQSMPGASVKIAK